MLKRRVGGFWCVLGVFFKGKSILVTLFKLSRSSLEISIYICEASLVLIKTEFVPSLRIIEIVAFPF